MLAGQSRPADVEPFLRWPRPDHRRRAIPWLPSALRMSRDGLAAAIALRPRRSRPASICCDQSELCVTVPSSTSDFLDALKRRQDSMALLVGQVVPLALGVCCNHVKAIGAKCHIVDNAATASLTHSRPRNARFAHTPQAADDWVIWISNNFSLDPGHSGFVKAHIAHAAQIRLQAENQHTVPYYNVVPTSMKELGI